jgi:polar amino acid transport system substrate-binding protein
LRTAARLIVGTWLLAASLAVAQAPQLPLTWFPQRAPSIAGQAIPICIDRREPAHAIDARIAEEIAAALLIEFQLIDVGRAFVDEFEYEELYVDLIDRCTAYAGFKLYPATYPEWLTFTRPFYEARFVMVARPNGPTRLTNLPPGTRVGVSQGTMGDVRFLAINNARPAQERLRRLPLGTPETVLRALSEGRVDAAIVWEPWWWALTSTHPEFAELVVVEAPAIAEPWIGVGAALTADRIYARGELDRALAALARDGTLTAILNEAQGFPGRAATGGR